MVAIVASFTVESRAFSTTSHIEACKEHKPSWMSSGNKSIPSIAFGPVVVGEGRREVKGDRMRSNIDTVSRSGGFAVSCWSKFSRVRELQNVYVVGSEKYIPSGCNMGG